MYVVLAKYRRENNIVAAKPSMAAINYVQWPYRSEKCIGWLWRLAGRKYGIIEMAAAEISISIWPMKI